MSIILTISIISLIIGIIVYRKRDTEIGWAIIVLTVMFGFGMFGFGIPVDSNLKEITNYELIKTPYRVIIDTEQGFESFTDIKYYHITKDDIKVYEEERRNSYGINCYEDRIEIKLKE